MAFYAVLLRPEAGTPAHRIEASRYERNDATFDFYKGRRLVNRVAAGLVVEVERFEYSAEADRCIETYRDARAGSGTMFVTESTPARPVRDPGPGRSAATGRAGSPPAEGVSFRVIES